MNDIEFELNEGWISCWALLKLAPPADAFAQLIATYSDDNRAYHDISHLHHVITLYREFQEHFVLPGEAGIALFYHDAIYDPKRSDNEPRSADMAEAVMVQAGAGHAAIAAVRTFIMATCHDAVPEDPDAKLVVDIDLSVLGSSDETYQRYVQDVRNEYSHVPGFLFKRGRRKVMESFLKRESIYQTPLFRERFEAKARENIRRELDS